VGLGKSIRPVRNLTPAIPEGPLEDLREICLTWSKLWKNRPT